MPGIYSRRVVTTWTPEQWVAVQAAAQQAGLSAVAYVRSTTLAAVGTPADAEPVATTHLPGGHARQPEDPEPPGPPPVPTQPDDTFIARPGLISSLPPVVGVVTPPPPAEPVQPDHRHRAGKQPASEWFDHGQRYVRYACTVCGALLEARAQS